MFIFAAYILLISWWTIESVLGVRSGTQDFQHIFGSGTREVHVAVALHSVGFG